MKSELAKKRDEWFDSQEFKNCMQTPVYESQREYLKNRLEVAWLAGEKAASELILTRISQILLSHKLDGKYTEKEALVEIAKIVAEN